jgi:sulfite exporter TauE/SafE
MNVTVDPLVISALLMGLFGGVHCVAMCGGVVGVLCSAAPGSCGARQHGESTAPFWLAYHAGRLGSYALLGLVFGSASSLAPGGLPLDAVRYALRVVAALCMLAVGLHLMGLPSMVSGAERLGGALWRRVAPLTTRLLPLRRPRQAFALGGLWGLMPCGLLYGALALAASADSSARAAEIMAAFGLGTLPIMLTMSALAATVARWLARAWVRRAAGVVVLAFGLWSTAGVAQQVGLASTPHHCCAGHPSKPPR